MTIRTPWFGPRKFGWGWTPITWQGWLVAALFCVLATGSAFLLGPSPITDIVLTGWIALLIVICSLTGSRPGGPGLD